jgi:hypothetical protein
VQAPDRLTPVGSGTIAALNYVGGLGGPAAVQYDGSAGSGRLVYFGFPFETITSANLRGDYMADILRFFSKPVRFEAIALLPDKRTQITLSAEPGLTYAIQVSSNLNAWSHLTNILNLNGTFSFVDAQAADQPQRFYRAVLIP